MTPKPHEIIFELDGYRLLKTEDGDFKFVQFLPPEKKDEQWFEGPSTLPFPAERLAQMISHLKRELDTYKKELGLFRQAMKEANSSLALCRSELKKELLKPKVLRNDLAEMIVHPTVSTTSSRQLEKHGRSGDISPAPAPPTPEEFREE